jgi:hypothetical protein
LQAATSSEAFRLEAAHEWMAHDPFGRPRPTDRSSAPCNLTDTSGAVVLHAARNGYVSFRVLVHGQGGYHLAAFMEGPLEVDLYRAWYHRVSGACWPDALIPVRQQVLRIPDPDNRIEGQTTQEFWVDVFIPADVTPGQVTGQIRLTTKGRAALLPVHVHVLEAILPDRPCIVMDHNSYGSRWLPAMYPQSFARAASAVRRWEQTIELMQDYHRLVHEHRGLFHNLGYGHSGEFDPIYGPRATGRGREKELVDWELYDRQYGPLLDGSAFETAAPGMPPPRQPASPVWAIYTPINPDWPASYLLWGEPGYEVEFNRCVGQFDDHLRENGWTHTHIEFFFNHKKRYRWFEWDGDEVKHLKDMRYHQEMVRLWEQAIGDTPVQWVYRSDASWQMVSQFERMSGHRSFWVCGEFHRWYPDQVRQVLDRGDTVWWYGGTPPVQAATSSILSNVYQTWARGLGGYCAWLTTDPGPDPWFDCDGCATGSIYPGERFGIGGPIPSIRLKVQRNGIQDIDLLDQVAKSVGNATTVRRELERIIPIQIWSRPPPAAEQLPPEEWDSRNLADEHEPVYRAKEALDPFWWQVLRDRALAQGANDGRSSP